jgi:hypothetical protein
MISSFNQHASRQPLAVAAAAALALAGLSVPAPSAMAERPQQGSADQFACATAAGAQRPGGRDDKDDERRDNDGRRGRGGGMTPFDFGWGYGRNHADLRAPRAHEWAEVQFFMNRHSPRRQAALDELPDDEKKESLKRFVFARFRSLQALQKRDRTGYEQRLMQLAVEDQIYGLVSDWAAAPDADPNRLRDALQSEVSRLVELDLQERRRRIEWLKKELEEESEKVQRDEKDRDAQVERRVSRYADWAEKWAARRARKDKDKVPEDPAEKQKRD